MKCIFETVPCADPGVICKKCVTCGKTANIPAAIAAGWPKIEAELIRLCQTPEIPPVDVSPPVNPAAASPPQPPLQPVKTGAGTELKKLLAKFGIKATPNCRCNARARTMDENGLEWCEKNIPLITEWLREEAQRRRLPFSEFAAKILIRRAITNARK